MCGIIGFVDNTHNITEKHLQDACATLKPSSEVENRIFFEANEWFSIGLANQLPSTIGSKGKINQPITSSCGLYTIILNGTLYNYVELREILIKYGVIFSTLTDSEVLLECYKKWGRRMFERLDGSLSFGIIDRDLKQCVVYRDFIGTKPLFYYKMKGMYAFGSEIKSILSLPSVEKKINSNAIATYFRFGYFAGTDTIYENIFQFEKGTITVIDLHSGNNYDEPIFINSSETLELPSEDETQVIERVEELLTESILKRNVADVPTGILLNSGYDSAVLAALLQKNQSKRIKTFTIGFESNKFDEAKKTKLIAQHLKTSHKDFYFTQKEAVDLFESLPSIFEEPIGDSAALAFLFMGKSVNNEVKVLLGAEGGDVLFGGYRAYLKAIKMHGLPSQVPSFLKSTFNQLLKYAPAKTQEVINADNLLNTYQNINACFTQQEIEKLLGHSNYFVARQKKGEKNLKDLMKYDLENYLPNGLLYRDEKCLMHCGIENREAFLKNDVVSYLSKLDEKWFLRDGKNKYLLKQITHKYLPELLVDNTKRGFTIPLPLWLKTCLKPFVETYLSTEKLNAHGILKVSEVMKIKSAFYLNGSIKNAKKIWLLVQFQMWYEKWG
ncbi:MAG: asparagine synthase (glutamine-hydrolyzing) [Pedobacter sp.]|nr:MAG: asparagine synthase (glutamine-hydrolyzing) [Pedobacter sp.]